jgi:hypothetical protein
MTEILVINEYLDFLTNLKQVILFNKYYYLINIMNEKYKKLY